MRSVAGNPWCFRYAPRLSAIVAPVVSARPGSWRKGVIRANYASENAFKNLRNLGSVGFTERQSEMMLSNFHTSTDFVKKADLAELIAKLDQVKVELRAELKQTRTELSAKIKQSKTELSAEIKQSKTELSAEIKQSNIELSADIKLQAAQTSKTLLLIAMVGLLLVDPEGLSGTVVGKVLGALMSLVLK